MKNKIKKTTIITKYGWIEKTEEYHKIIDVSQDILMSVDDWVNTNKKLGLKKRRTQCNMCGINFKSINKNESVYLAFTSQGNRFICESCKNSYNKKGE